MESEGARRRIEKDEAKGLRSEDLSYINVAVRFIAGCVELLR
jgi:hypothetical protein